MPVAAPPPQVLVVSDARGYRHASTPTALRTLDRLPGTTVLRRTSELTTTRLRQADVVVLVSTTGSPPIARTPLARFVREGGGLVALHATTNAFRDWPDFGRLLGARFVRHPPLRRDTVTASMPGVPRRFTVTDEFYVHDRAPDATVVARLATHDRRVLAWRKREGRGRVFVSTLGHPVAAWRPGDARLSLARSGIRWAARR